MLAAQLAQAVDPAGGAPTEDLVPATIVALVAGAGLGALAWAHRAGRTRVVDALARLARRVPVLRGLPDWAALPIAVTTGSLLIAVFGFYWDVSTHIDNGRDAGPFANPAHFFIVVGLAGIALAGFFSVLLATGRRDAGRDGQRSITAPVGGVLLVACGTIALAGFPLDDVWHRIFGQDVTLWGPTHIQMVAGASLSTLAMWVLAVEGARAAGAQLAKGMEVAIAGAFLIGLATLQAEFDFAVPQFRLLYQPVLISLAAAIGLVAARVRVGRGGAIGAALFFLALRGVLALLVGPVLGRSMPHFPLFAVEALVVEVAAMVVPRARTVPLRLGAIAGLGIGTAGVLAEWGWSGAWMPNPWPAALVGEALPWTVAAGVAGGVLGALAGRALAGGEVARTPVLRWVGPLAGAVALVAIAWPLPTNSGDGLVADVTLRDLTPEPARTVEATVRLRPVSAAEGAEWFNVTAWQGVDWTRADVVHDDLGVWQTSEPIPVHGDWKALIRLHNGRTMAAVPIFLPHDAGIPAEEVPAPATFRRAFVGDKELLQREFTGGPGWLETAAYGSLAAIFVGWVALIVWGLGRLLPAPATAPAEVTGRARSRVGVARGPEVRT